MKTESGKALRLSALDLGTNSFHLLVAEVGEAGALRTITREKEMLRLGDFVSRSGRIGPVAIERAVAAIDRLCHVASAQGVSDVVAVATAAIREAADGALFVETVRERLGVNIQVISGEREAQLIFRSVQASVDFGGRRALACDIGGGSVELGVGTQHCLDWVQSLPLGVGRLSASYVSSDPIRKKEVKALEAYIRQVLPPAIQEASLCGYEMGIGTSGTLLTFARIARGDVDIANMGPLDGYRLDTGITRQICDELIRSDAATRAALPGLEPRRADLMPAAAVLVRTMLDELALPEMIFSTWGLREGVLLRQLDHPAFGPTDPRRTRSRSVLALGHRHGFDELHGRQTARLATALFDGLGETLKLDPAYREMLEHAGMLHDIGNSIARKGHHRHGAYMVAHSELAGFEPEQRTLLTALVRYHRSATPRAGQPEHDTLAAKDKTALAPLVALLRVADGLDSSRHGNVLGLDMTVESKTIVIRIVSTSGDPGLDLWGGRRKARLLEEVSGRQVMFLGPGEPRRDRTED